MTLLTIYLRLNKKSITGYFQSPLLHQRVTPKIQETLPAWIQSGYPQEYVSYHGNVVNVTSLVVVPPSWAIYVIGYCNFGEENARIILCFIFYYHVEVCSIINYQKHNLNSTSNDWYGWSDPYLLHYNLVQHFRVKSILLNRFF